MFRRIQFPALLALVLFTTAAVADNQPKTEQEKFSYTVGVQTAENMLQHGIEVDPAMYLQGVQDALDKKTFKLSPDEMKQVLVNYQQQQMKKVQEQAAANKAAGEKFLADNKTKPGVKTTASGLQYKVIKQGTGKKPTLDDEVVVNYEGSLLDGKVFDSSYKRGKPLSIKLDGVIKGWQEALPMMTVGSKWKVYVPADLAYGERGAGGGVIGPNSTLVFDIELMSIKADEDQK